MTALNGKRPAASYRKKLLEQLGQDFQAKRCRPPGENVGLEPPPGFKHSCGTHGVPGFGAGSVEVAASSGVFRLFVFSAISPVSDWGEHLFALLVDYPVRKEAG